MRVLAVTLMVLTGLMGPTVGWSQFASSERVGVIDKVELDTSSVIISGLRYRVALDADVEINGTFGALQLLGEGMKVRFVCQVISGEERQIVELETLPQSTVIEEA